MDNNRTTLIVNSNEEQCKCSSKHLLFVGKRIKETKKISDEVLVSRRDKRDDFYHTFTIESTTAGDT